MQSHNGSLSLVSRPRVYLFGLKIGFMPGETNNVIFWTLQHRSLYRTYAKSRAMDVNLVYRNSTGVSACDSPHGMFSMTRFHIGSGAAGASITL